MPTTRFTMSGQVAIVTGATRGLGRAVALSMAAVGADVALLGRREADLDGVAQEVQDLGVRAMPVRVDLAHTSGLTSIVDDVVAQLGAPKVLVNAGATDAPGSVQDLNLEDWNRVVAVNLTAPFMLSRAVTPHMQGSGGGLIVNVSSVAGRRGWANASAYCSTKFALTGLTQSLAAEGRADGIRVCVVNPGAMSLTSGRITWDASNVESVLPFNDDDAEQLALDPMSVVDRYYPGAAELLHERGVKSLAPITVYYPMGRAERVLGFEPECNFDRWLNDLSSRPEERVTTTPPWP